MTGSCIPRVSSVDRNGPADEARERGTTETASNASAASIETAQRTRRGSGARRKRHRTRQQRRSHRRSGRGEGAEHDANGIERVSNVDRTGAADEARERSTTRTVSNASATSIAPAQRTRRGSGARRERYRTRQQRRSHRRSGRGEGAGHDGNGIERVSNVDRTGAAD